MDVDGCGSPSSSTARASSTRIDRGVTLEAGDDVVERGDVPPALLPGLDPARVDDLHAERLRSRPGVHATKARSRSRSPSRIAIHHIMIITHQDEERLVDDRACRRVRGASCRRHEGRDGGVDGRRVAEPGVFRPGGERARDAAERPRPAGDRPREFAPSPRLLGPHRRAALTFGPAMWQWTSTPAGITTSPRASMVRSARARGRRASARRPSSIQRSATPSTPLAGSTTRPPLIRSSPSGAPPGPGDHASCGRKWHLAGKYRCEKVSSVVNSSRLSTGFRSVVTRKVH